MLSQIHLSLLTLCLAACAPFVAMLSQGVERLSREEFDSLIKSDKPIYINGERIYRVEELQQRVRVTSKPAPFYPDEARKNRVEGMVQLRVLLFAGGKVEVLHVLKALPDGLTEQAIEAAKGITFSPGTIDGKPVSTVVVFEYVFSLGLKSEGEVGVPEGAPKAPTAPRVVIGASPTLPRPGWQGKVAGNIPAYKISKRNDENLLSVLLPQPLPEVWLEFSGEQRPRDSSAKNGIIKVKLPDKVTAILKEYWTEVIKFDYSEAFLKRRPPQEKADRAISLVHYTEGILNKLTRVEIDAPDGKRPISDDEATAIIMFVHRVSIGLVNTFKESQNTKSIALINLRGLRL